DRLPSSWAQLVQLDEDWDEIDRQPGYSPEAELVGGNQAYVLFTSGSTGSPKGVAIEHGSLLNYVRGICARLELAEEARYALVSTIAADLGYTGVYGSLCSGGALHVLSAERVVDGGEVSGYFEERGIECCKTVPSLMKALMSGGSAERV